MLIMCPFCGHHLPQPLLDGMSSCLNCRRVFDSSRRNLLLSSAWLVRHQDLGSPDSLVNHYHLTHEDATFIIEMVFEQCYNHEEFRDVLNDYLETAVEKSY